MYDDFSADYDRFVDWPGRLAVEMPFIVGRIGNSSYVLDAACGTGMHAIALAQRGYAVAGADLSVGMIERARANAEAAGVVARFEVAGFGELAGAFTPALSPALTPALTPALSQGEREQRFDAVLCLGNSLPHLLTPADLEAALADFAACLRPGGLLLIQNRNFDAVLARRERWMGPQAHWDGDAEWLFLRFYDFEPDGTLTFNLLTLRRALPSPSPSPQPSPLQGEGEGAWSQKVTSTRLWPLRQEELVAALETVGFGGITCFGDMQGGPFDPQVSGNFIVAGRRA
jgi:SAM-dependent methyltransferase